MAHMPNMRTLMPVGADYPVTGPNQNTLRQAMPVRAATLFRCLEDGPAWKEWLGIEVEWTSPEPFGVGTTRTVTRKAITIDEVFFTWVDGEEMGFRFDRTTLPVRSFAELYDCVPIGDTTCELRWSYAFEWAGPLPAVLGRAFGVYFAFAAKRSLRKLAALLEKNPERWA